MHTLQREGGVGKVFAPAVHSPGPAAAPFFFLLVSSVAALHTTHARTAIPSRNRERRLSESWGRAFFMASTGGRWGNGEMERKNKHPDWETLRFGHERRPGT